MATQQYNEKQLLSFLKELTVILQKRVKQSEKPKKKKIVKKSTKKSAAAPAKKAVTIRAAKSKTGVKTSKPKRKISRYSFKRSSAPQELTGISSTNIGETQHTESPKTSFLAHIPLSSPAANVSGSNALSSMEAQRAKNNKKNKQFSNNQRQMSYATLRDLLHTPDTSSYVTGANLDPMSDKHGRREKNKNKR